jgi:hypothetical protein
MIVIEGLVEAAGIENAAMGKFMRFYVELLHVLPYSCLRFVASWLCIPLFVAYLARWPASTAGM